jgi:ATP-dependent helicase HrpB
LDQARVLLQELGAIDGNYRITPHGRRMVAIGLHPRLAHMILEGERLGVGALACDLAALLSERDVLMMDPNATDADLRLRVDVLHRDARAAGMLRSTARIDRTAVRRVRAESERWQRALRLREAHNPPRDAPAMIGVLAGFAYPDRIAQLRAGSRGRFLLRNGRGAVLRDAQGLSDVPFLVVADVDDQPAESRIFLAASLTKDDLYTYFSDQMTRDATVEWDASAQAVRARLRERLGAIILRDAPWRDPDQALVTNAILEAVAREGLGMLSWTDTARHTQARIAFLRTRDANATAAEAWPDVSEAHMLATLPEWLAPHVSDATTLDDVRRVDLNTVLLGMLAWPQRAALDERAPAVYHTPAGSRVPIDYGNPDAPAIAVRLQELFGVRDTPRVDRGAVALTIHLLSPARRPVQVTRDLAGFWRTSYFDVKKELKGRYPKHVWPDDPLSEPPTRSAKRR